MTRRTGITPTSAPLARYSAVHILDEDSRPSAPEPPAEIEFTAPGQAVGRHLVDVHDHFRRELEQVRDILDQVRAGAAAIGAARAELNIMTIRANDWTLGGYCQAHCLALTQHHGMEDQGIFGHLRDSQPDLGEVLDRLVSEHRAIADLLHGVDSALVHLAANPTDYAPITAAIDVLTDTLASHFAYEERELIGPLSRYGFYPGQL